MIVGSQTLWNEGAMNLKGSLRGKGAGLGNWLALVRVGTAQSLR